MKVTLENLSFQDQKISLNNIVENKDYFANMKLKKNFILPKPNNTCCNFIIFYIKSIKNLSVFGIATEEEIHSDINYNILSVSDLILYDSIVNKCAYVEYERGLSGAKIERDTLQVSCSANKFVTRFIGLDNGLNPYSSINFLSYSDSIGNVMLTNFINENGSCVKKSEYLKLNINQLNFMDLYDLLKRSPHNADNIPCNIDDSFVLYHFF